VRLDVFCWVSAALGALPARSMMNGYGQKRRRRGLVGRGWTGMAVVERAMDAR